MPAHDHLWNEQEVARYLSVSPYTVRSWRQKGKIGYVEIGGVIRYVPEEIKAFAVANRKPPHCFMCGEAVPPIGDVLLPGEVNPDEPPYFSDLKQTCA